MHVHTVHKRLVGGLGTNVVLIAWGGAMVGCRLACFSGRWPDVLASVNASFFALMSVGAVRVVERV